MKGARYSRELNDGMGQEEPVQSGVGGAGRGGPSGEWKRECEPSEAGTVLPATPTN